MPGIPWFHLPAGNWAAPYELDGAQARHLTDVLRLGPVDEVVCFDGIGRVGTFRVQETSRRKVRLDLLEMDSLPLPEDRPVLALGWNKSARRGYLLEKAVELRAGELWFFQARRSQGRIPEEAKPTWTDKLISGAKQSRNPFLPDIRLFASVEEMAAAADPDWSLVLLSTAREASRLTVAEFSGPRCLAAIGPEGGLADNEEELLFQAGFSPRSLGPGVLRWETAALLCLGLAWWARDGY
jgi:16S rRNA (uracil1498-N3)-methyltransferase